MDWTRQQRQVTNSTGGFSFQATACQAPEETRAQRDTREYYHSSSSLIPCLLLPLIIIKDDKRSILTTHDTRDFLQYVGNLHYNTTVYGKDLTLIIETVPEMKYRRRTGENSKRPERIEHTCSLT